MQHQTIQYEPQRGFVRFGRAFVAGVKAAPKRTAAKLKGFFQRGAARARDFFLHFTEGDGITKTSYLVMGLGHLLRGQAVRGGIYLAAELLFILYMVAFGGRYLGMFLENFPAGGNVGRVETHVSGVWDEELGEYVKIAGDMEALPYIKEADKLSAYLKCLEEQKAGNTDFDSAARQTWDSMVAMDRPELNWFLDNCLEAFTLTLDQL